MQLTDCPVIAAVCHPRFRSIPSIPWCRARRGKRNRNLHVEAIAEVMSREGKV